ncbi:hypothetical protein OHC33_004307 [Knufia fluminis]|uniref:Uncharacterized protein n=1 Tax=Knufia fluminis TaxID=191047 RepID=A0AAN8ERN6_9EURO|nr:hypothetical protein OHC33_004307 [Knufia fluminis]
MADPSRPAYPPPQEYHQGYAQQHSPPRPEDNRTPYPPPPDAGRQGQYPPAPHPYPPPQQWAGHPQGPPTPGLPLPSTAKPARPSASSPRSLPPAPSLSLLPIPSVSAPTGTSTEATYGDSVQVLQEEKSMQDTFVSDIRCSGYDSSPDGRCQNCVRFNQQCLFHPVSSQAAFVPAAALYGPGGPGARAPMAGSDGQGQNGQAQPMLYGAHGQPLGPAGPGGQPQYAYPPPNAQPPPPQHQGYPPGPYQNYPPQHYGQGPPPPNGAPAQYDQNAHQPPPTASSDRSDRGSLKRGPPEDDSHESAANSPHPNARPRHSAYEGRPSGSFEHQSPTSPAMSTMSYQSYPQNNYGNGAQPVKGNNSPPAGLTPNSIHSFNSPHDSRTPPPAQPGSAGSSQNGRSGMKVHEMLGSSNHPQYGHEQRGKSDNEMLSKLDGKK